MTPTDTALDGEGGIRARIAERVHAVRAKDVDALLSGYATDFVGFDLVMPLANRGLDILRRRVADWFSSFATDIDYQVRAVNLAVGTEVALEHHLTRVRGKTVVGESIDMWFRETVGYRKIAGVWKVTHQHSSVPMDSATGKARLDLQPTL